MNIDSHIVGAIVAAQFPQLAPVRASYLGGGYDSQAYDVNGAWVFRFPNRADVEQQQLVEARILPVIAESAPIPVPAIRFLGQPSADFPHHFGGYAKLLGVPAIHIDPADVPFARLAPRLGRLLSHLHGVPHAEAACLGVEARHATLMLDEIRAEALEDFDVLREAAPGAPLDAWYAYLSEAADLEPEDRHAVLAHTDLAAEHILIEPASYEITGVIDWSDLAIADPAIDFAGMFHWGGDALLDAVLAEYAHPVDDRLRARARFFAACRGVGDVVFAVRCHRPEYLAGGLRALALAVDRP